MGEKAKRPKCKAMEGWGKEGSAVIEEDMEDRVKDAALIAAAQRLNITKWLDTAACGGMPVCSATPSAALLEKTQEEEKVADEVLGGIAEEINVEIPRGQNQGAQPMGNRAGLKIEAGPLIRRSWHHGERCFRPSHIIPDGALLQVFQFDFTE
jgi:hypothetical protein